MPNLRQISLASMLLCIMLSTVAAQESSTGAKATPTITVNSTADRIRVTAPSSIVQLRLEVYAASGEKVFDQELRGANVFDWHLQNGQAQRLPAGDYVCVVTAKSISGKLTQKIGAVTLAENSASVRHAETLSAGQAQAIGPVEENSAWTMAEGDNPTTTVIASNGSEGQMIRGRGALTFRIGNFFSGIDTEQMRLTEDGRLGIGTSTPQATLDVAGTIRAQRFLVVTPNLTGGDKTAAGVQATDAPDSVQPLIAGSGTQNQIAKWIDGAGTLGDSGITETNTGRVGVGITSPLSKFHISSPFDALRMTSPNDTSPVWAQFNTSLGSGLGYFGVEGNTPNIFLSGTLPYATALSSGAAATALQLGSAGSVKMTILSGGNVGIGLNNPTAKLDVAGNINTSTQYSIGGSPALSVSGVDLFGIGPPTNTFVGVDAGKSNIAAPDFGEGLYNSFFGSAAGQLNVYGSGNSFFGIGAGFRNFTGDGNSFFGQGAGYSNTEGHFNTFFASGSANTTGSNNSFFGLGAGQSNTVQDNNTLIGSSSDVSAGITNATALGYKAKVTQSNSLVLGSINTVNSATADTNVGIGTTAPGYRLDVVGRARIKQNAGQTGGTNSAGLWLFQNSPAADRAFVGMESDNSVGFFGGNGGGWGMIMNTQNGNVGIGTTGPLFKLQVLDQSNSGLRVQTSTGGGLVASFGGFGDFQIDAAGGPGVRLTVKENGFVGIGLNNPDRALVVNGSAAKPGGGSWDAFSDERLKTIKGSFTPGLKAVMQLQPLRYEYKPDNALGIRSSGEHIGFGAQAVQKIIPEAVTKNDAGYLLVNNDPILWTMLNAIKEQQKEVEAQQRIAQQQQDEIAALRSQNSALNARLQMIERTLRKKSRRR